MTEREKRLNEILKVWSKKDLWEQAQNQNRIIAELRARLEKAIEVPFVVLDKTTGKEADLGEIALHEEWAKSLVYCDMDGFAITQDGALLLLDECGKFEYCPSDRFEIVAETRLKELKEKKDD